MAFTLSIVMGPSYHGRHYCNSECSQVGKTIDEQVLMLQLITPSPPFTPTTYRALSYNNYPAGMKTPIQYQLDLSMSCSHMISVRESYHEVLAVINGMSMFYFMVSGASLIKNSRGYLTSGIWQFVWQSVAYERNIALYVGLTQLNSYIYETYMTFCNLSWYLFWRRITVLLRRMYNLYLLDIIFCRYQFQSI